MSLWNPGSLVTGPMDVAWWSRPAPGSRGALGLSLGEVGSNAAGFLQPSWVQTAREGTGGEELVSDRDAHQLPSAPALRPGLFPVTFGASPQTLGWRGVSWRCAWASTATRGSGTRNCSLRSDTGLGPSLPSDRCHPRLHGSGPTLGGSLAREPDPQDTFGKALAACTRRELRSGALGTRYRPPNRRPQARVTLVSVSPVELRTSRAGANWVLWPPGSAFPWRTWLTSTHLYCSPTGLDSRGLETERRMKLARHRKVWYRLAGRVHASPARVFQRGVAGDVGRLQAGGCERRGVGRAQAGSGFSEGRGERECLGPPARVDCGGSGRQGLVGSWGKPPSGEEDQGFPEGERTRRSRGRQQGAQNPR
ncbi:uncharacterized protein LOC115522445 [Lynx canadensis]|uniref:uncharacterized protein LOC115522445 n=1 Tax=Lynx canadensis TaxID=61383 RepID=UPI0011B030FA|nr:uncharacterized protein LOC115522445 [Lynx canadensis]